MQQALAIVAVKHFVCMPDFFVQGQAHGVLLVWVSNCGERPALRAILMHGFVRVDAKFEKRWPQPSFGSCGGLAIKKSTDPAQAVKASTVKPKR